MPSSQPACAEWPMQRWSRSIAALHHGGLVCIQPGGIAEFRGEIGRARITRTTATWVTHTQLSPTNQHAVRSHAGVAPYARGATSGRHNAWANGGRKRIKRALTRQRTRSSGCPAWSHEVSRFALGASRSTTTTGSPCTRTSTIP